MQALQRDGSASLSISTGKVSTRKRKLAEWDAAAAAAIPAVPAAATPAAAASPAAAATPAAAAATPPGATTLGAAAAAAGAPDASQAASGADDQSVSALLASHPTDGSGQVASNNKDSSQAAVRSRRRASHRTAKTGGDKQAATTESALVARASEERHRDGSMEVSDPSATAVANSGVGADVDKQPWTGAGHLHLLEGQHQPGVKAEAVQPTAGKTRSQRGVAQPAGALIKVEDTSAAEAHAQARVPAGQSGADGSTAESERDRRLLARQMRSTGPKVKVNKGVACYNTLPRHECLA